MVFDLPFHDAPFIAALFLVLGPPLSVAWLIREFDQRQAERYEGRVNEESVDLRCPQCHGRFEPWTGGFVPVMELTVDRKPLGRRLHLTCRDCGLKSLVWDHEGRLEVESLLSENFDRLR